MILIGVNIYRVINFDQLPVIILIVHGVAMSVVDLGEKWMIRAGRRLAVGQMIDGVVAPGLITATPARG